MADYYDTMQVCENGHQITDYYDTALDSRKNFCAKCGAKTIFKCPKCNEKIKGRYHMDDIIDVSEIPVPTHCENCGEPYPWKEKTQKIPLNENKSGYATKPFIAPNITINNSNIAINSYDITQSLSIQPAGIKADLEEKIIELRQAVLEKNQSKIKSIFEYIADKAVDVAIAILASGLPK